MIALGLEYRLMTRFTSFVAVEERTVTAGGGDASAGAATVDARRWLTLLGHTAVVCGLAALTAIMLGIILALLATRTDMPGRRPPHRAELPGPLNRQKSR